ncbi:MULTISPECIES: hypothetical protein [Yersinia]|nr:MULTISPECIES: hypothetical protein [Yersinia]
MRLLSANPLFYGAGNFGGVESLEVITRRQPWLVFWGNEIT